MFFMGLLYVGLAILFVWLAWKLVIKEFLEAKGIEVEEEKVVEIVTPYTKKLEELKEEYVEKLVSAVSAKESERIKTEIEKLDKIIETCVKEGK